MLTQWWDQAPEAPYSVLTHDEAGFVRAWAGVAFPATSFIPLHGADAGLDRFFDRTLQTTPPDTTKLLRLLLHALDNGATLTHGGLFSSISPARQSKYFESWIHSDIAIARSAAQSLVLLLGFGWSIHPEVAPHMRKLHSCGYGA
jgi:hypothetical protein